MFTGLVEDVGKLEARTSRGPGARLRISTKLSPLVLGESIAVMGVCLTVDAIVRGGFEADASTETLSRSTLGALPIGHRVHLERALQVGARFGGHIMAGHVDGLTRLFERRPLGEAVGLTFSLEASIAAFVAPKGSIAIDGVSLTVNEVQADRFDVVIVPHTQGATLLGQMTAGVFANVEVDVLARYVARWLKTSPASAAGSQGSDPEAAFAERLAKSGFL